MICCYCMVSRPLSMKLVNWGGGGGGGIFGSEYGTWFCITHLKPWFWYKLSLCLLDRHLADMKQYQRQPSHLWSTFIWNEAVVMTPAGTSHRWLARLNAGWYGCQLWHGFAVINVVWHKAVPTATTLGLSPVHVSLMLGGVLSLTLFDLERHW